MYLFLCLLALGTTVFGKTLSKDVNLKACHRSDPNINPCLLEQADNVVKYLENGIPERGLQPLDPLNLEFMTVEGDLESIKIKMVMKNITLYGHSTAKFYRFKFDSTSLSGEMSFRIPVLRMTCDYFSTGRLFAIPLESSAHFDGNFTNMDMTLSFRLKTVQRKGKEYLSFDKANMDMNLDSGHMKMISIDPTQQQQVNVIQDFFNENDKLVIKTVKPIADEQGTYFYKHLIEGYIRRIPAFELLPY